MHILVIDDDDRLRQLLKQFLKKNNFNVSVSSNAIKAKKILNGFSFDLIVLDVMMPGKSGIEFLNELRSEFNTPVLLLTALDQIQDKITGFKSGADDYLTKPFDPEELLLRINNILKHTKVLVKEELKNVKFGSFIWDNATKKLSKNNIHVHTTNLENNLLSIFSQNIGIEQSRVELCKFLNLEFNNRSIDVGIARLRKKIENNPRKPQWLLTLRGKGWMLRATPLNET
jgi:two-component system phosphate regulon response regulator OmpR